MIPNVQSLLIPLFLAVGVLVGGCSTTQPEVKSGLAGPAEAVAWEKRVFASAARYYCNKMHWPKTWQELVEFEAARSEEADSLLRFKDPQLTSPRAILLTMTYAREDKSLRTASFIAPPYCAEVNPDPREVSIAGSGIVFRLPNGFTLMKGSDIRAWWKAPPYPDAVWKSQDDTLIAIRFGDAELAPEQTAEFLHDLSEAYEASVPSLRWRARDVRLLGSATLLRHEFENNSSRGQLINVVLSASFGGYLFAITVTGPTERAATVLAAADQVEASLRIRPEQDES